MPKDEGDFEETELDEFEIQNEIDENQLTVKSYFSVNTQDSATYHLAPLQCGNIRFVKDTVEFSAEVNTHSCFFKLSGWHRG